MKRETIQYWVIARFFFKTRLSSVPLKVGTNDLITFYRNLAILKDLRILGDCLMKINIVR